MILLDINVVSAVMASKPSLTVLAWLDANNTDHLFLSTVTIAEIGYGLRILPEGQRRQGLERRFSAFVARGFEHRTLSFDVPAASHYAEIMALRRSIGCPMSVPDAEIAAIALANGMALGTRNLTDFEACGLALVNPFAYSTD